MSEPAPIDMGWMSLSQEFQDAALAARDACPFCEIVAGRAPATTVRRWMGAVAIKPRHPVTPGHVLVIPAVHVEDVGVDPAVSALTMSAAAELAAEHPACNIITSRGTDATQTVFHLHIHVVPRRAGDGLALPWTHQKPWTEGS